MLARIWPLRTIGCDLSYGRSTLRLPATLPTLPSRALHLTPNNAMRCLQVMSLPVLAFAGIAACSDEAAPPAPKWELVYENVTPPGILVRGGYKFQFDPTWHPVTEVFGSKRADGFYGGWFQAHYQGIAISVDGNARTIGPPMEKVSWRLDEKYQQPPGILIPRDVEVQKGYEVRFLLSKPPYNPRSGTQFGFNPSQVTHIRKPVN